MNITIAYLLDVFKQNANEFKIDLLKICLIFYNIYCNKFNFNITCFIIYYPLPFNIVHFHIFDCFLI